MKKLLLIVSLSLAALVGAFVWLGPAFRWWSGVSSDAEVVKILSAAPSPDGKYVAEIYVRMGGGPAGYVLHHVGLRYAMQPLDPKRYVYWGRGDGKIEVVWVDVRRLVIRSGMEPRFLTALFEDVQIICETP